MAWTSRIPVVGLLLLQIAVAQTTLIDHWETVLYADTVWSYFIGTTEPDANWRQLPFDDSAWPHGIGGIGYGDGDDNTVIDTCISLYLRTSFTIFDTSKIDSAVLHVDYDDAFVAYINGVEVARANIGEMGDHPSHDQLAVDGHEARIDEGLVPPEFTIDKETWAEMVTPGENLLAVQVHNVDSTSSDLSSATFLSVGVTDTTFTYLTTPDWFQPPQPPLVFISSNLPIIVIDTEGQDIPDPYKITAHMGIIDNGPGQRNYLTDPYNDYDGRIGIEIRGASSTMFPKKQYAVETRDDQGENLNVSLIGLPPENDWILYAPYSDKSLIRNVLAYRLWENMGHYSSRSRLCELVLNDEYWGVYVLMEKIKRDKNRVDIATLNPDETTGDDLTGGYIIKIDKWAGENIGGWESPFLPYPGAWQRVYYQYHYPKPDEIVPAQKDYVEEVVTAFESKMASSNYNDPVTGYTAYIDVDSFIDYFLINELGKNVDGYRLSAFMHKDKDSKGGKLKMGPVWDFNLAFGNADYYDGWYYTGWGIDYLSNNSDFRRDEWSPPPFWWCKLLQDRAFASRLNTRWQELMEGVFHIDTLFAFIDSAVNVLDEARIRNFEKWPVLGTYVWPNAYVGQTYEEEVQYLKGWIDNRVLWIDANIGNIDEDLVTDPERFTLRQNYPNPFNLATTLQFDLPHATHVQLIIYDLQGREIIRLADGRIPAGPQRRVWQGRASDGRDVPSSLYFAQLTTPGYVTSIKMLLLR